MGLREGILEAAGGGDAADRAAAHAVRIADELKGYIVALARATREASSVQLGCGPRASIALTQVARSLALIDGESFVRPEHVREAAQSVLASPQFGSAPQALQPLAGLQDGLVKLG